MDKFTQQMAVWLHQPLGKVFAREESRRLRELLPKMFGYHLLQIGGVPLSDTLDASPIQHRMYLNESGLLLPGLQGKFSDLPFLADSIDTIILPHLLEFSDDPEATLKEVTRVLIPEGNLIIFGFRPYSLMGLAKSMNREEQRIPWNGHYLSAASVSKQLNQLGCDTQQQENYFYRWPYLNEHRLNKPSFFEKVGPTLWPCGAGAYMIVAKKRVAELKPITPRWQVRRWQNNKNLEPTTRGSL